MEAHHPHIKNKVYWHVFPTYAEAKDAVWRDPNMLFRVIPPELIDRTNESELVLYLKSGSIIQLKGSDKPERLRGAGPYGVVLDEFAEQKAEVWDAIIQPIIRANGGWCWFIGTPRGTNHLHKHYQWGLDKSFKEWKSWLLKASTSAILLPDQLAEARRTSLPHHYNQEFECEFLEGEGAVFRNVRRIANAAPEKPMAEQLYVMGVDLAKTRDYTVMSVFKRSSNAQVYQKRFRGIEWPYQKKQILAVSQHFNNAVVVVDATGLGDPVADDLARFGIPVVPFKITNQTKKELIEKLAIYIDHQRIKILNIPDSLLEYDNFEYEMSNRGRIYYQAKEGFHDDIVLSHALAVSELSDKAITIGKIPKPLIRRHYEEQAKSWEDGYPPGDWAESVQ